ncbi:FKBP-type peptidyl-prolyl cis-trans isomerase [Halobacteriovorax sp. GB3]|uniref:FKBP-type peptidyl-prolyl cis-trans isomerase n=1 Tax=Halobacteriovorax sp. GB3 TaxID=2719615 RepID=UPI00236306AE|nr:FKBP-type peptidyl-prolyl cis-trans isomerase [Halobacteriovorax sp. GB3]MDD0853535.1 FKBP-type peptidyl-prolyl cis-trans isomerase [Halobacteriovorax sp. GB3]
MSVNWEKVSYILGQQIGADFKNQGVDINLEAFLQSFREAFNGEQIKMESGEITEVMQAFQAHMQAQEQERMQKAAEINLEESLAFLAENASNEGVVTLESGLQYRVLTEGTGKKPTGENSVVAHYEGKLINGVVFDSSVQRGQPATFPVNRVIAGWTEALQLMGEGAKWQLFIPAELAYGQAGAPPAIGPNQALIFEVELLEVQ